MSQPPPVAELPKPTEPLASQQPPNASLVEKAAEPMKNTTGAKPEAKAEATAEARAVEKGQAQAAEQDEAQAQAKDGVKAGAQAEERAAEQTTATKAEPGGKATPEAKADLEAKADTEGKGKGEEEKRGQSGRRVLAPYRLAEKPVFIDIINKLMKGTFHKVVVLTGSGVSQSAGIPDIRACEKKAMPELSEFNLPFPEAVFTTEFFQDNPQPLYKLASKLFAKNYVPTKAHYFLRLLQDKNYLLRNYTHNLDCLELSAGLRPELVVHAHGMLQEAHCIQCQTPAESELLKNHLRRGEPLMCPKCHCPFKPDVVFYGEGMPKAFREHIGELRSECDLLIIMGSSLSALPFCIIPQMLGKDVPLLLINNELPIIFGKERPKAFVHLEKDINHTVDCLVEILGWTAEYALLLKERAARIPASLITP